MKMLTTITGPSCAGKSTLEAMMAERGCLRAISTTTRPPRAGEVDGVNYYYVDKSQFKRLMTQGAFIENVEFGGHFYGITSTEVKRLFDSGGSHIVIVCEPVGAAQIRHWCSRQDGIKLRQVFIDNPDSVIAERFTERLMKELMNASAEKSSAEAYEKVKQSYAKRLGVMLTEEVKWRKNLQDYDFCVSHFDASNAQAVVDVLMESIPVPEIALAA